MAEFVDNNFQKVPSKELVKNTAEKVKSAFFKMGIEIHSSQ